jgi:hypothetical protein
MKPPPRLAKLAAEIARFFLYLLRLFFAAGRAHRLVKSASLNASLHRGEA